MNRKIKDKIIQDYLKKRAEASTEAEVKIWRVCSKLTPGQSIIMLHHVMSNILKKLEEPDIVESPYQ